MTWIIYDNSHYCWLSLMTCEVHLTSIYNLKKMSVKQRNATLRHKNRVDLEPLMRMVFGVGGRNDPLTPFPWFLRPAIWTWKGKLVCKLRSSWRDEGKLWRVEKTCNYNPLGSVVKMYVLALIKTSFIKSLITVMFLILNINQVLSAPLIINISIFVTSAVPQSCLAMENFPRKFLLRLNNETYVDY